MNRLQGFLISVLPRYRERIFQRFLSGDRPVFSSFGQNIYLSDIVKNALNAIAVETSKITLKSVVCSDNPRTVKVENDSITRLFAFAPNPLMTTRDFFYKVAYLRKTRQNVFIYPKYYIGFDGKREYTGFYPLNPTDTQFGYIDGTDTLAVKLTFAQGEEYTFRYDELIHLRGDYTLNEFLGGDENGESENRELLKTADIMDKVMQGMPKAISAALTIKGVYNVKSVIGQDKLNTSREDFEKAVSDSNKGIIALGYDGDFTPVNMDPKLIPSDVLNWLETKMLKTLGVSMAIVTGDFTEVQSSAFYQKCIEDFVIQAEQAFSAVLYTEEGRARGQQVKIYDRLVQHLSMDTKLKIVQYAAPMGVFGRDDVRELLGYEPLGDNTIMQSLNWIDTASASAYQLERVRGASINQDRERSETDGSATKNQ